MIQSKKQIFFTEIIRIYNNILANKLDNDQLIDLKKYNDNDINKLNTNNHTQSTMESRKRKYNNKESDFSNIQQTSIIKSSFKKSKNQSTNKSFISRFNKKKSITNITDNDKNTKTNDDITHEKEKYDDINNLSVGLMSRESLFIISSFL